MANYRKTPKHKIMADFKETLCKQKLNASRIVILVFSDNDMNYKPSMKKCPKFSLLLDFQQKCN